MSTALHRVSVLLLACSAARAQQVRSTDLHPLPGPLQRVGTFDVAHRRWVNPERQGAAHLNSLTVYDNTCTWTGGSFYTGTGSCEDYFGDGRIPSPSSASPLGATTDNLINYFEIGYCTAVPTGAVDIKVGFYDSLGGPCLGGIAPTPPPLTTQAVAYFDLGAGAGFPLPGATTSGVLECFVVGFANTGFCLQSDADGVFDNLAALDNFAWSFQMENPSGAPQNGIVLAGEPSASPVGGCTYDIPCGTDPNNGNPCGHGLGQSDSFWINVDNDLVGDGTNTGVTCVSSPSAGSTCYWFGGHPGNPYAGVYLKLGSAGECAGCDGNPTTFCTASISSSGCVATMTLTGVPSPKPLAPPALVSAIGLEGQRRGRILFSLQTTSVPWSPSGFLCVKAPYYEVKIPNSGGVLGQCNGVIAADLNDVIQSGSGTLLGQTMFVGSTVYAQCRYRDKFWPFTKDRLSDALQITLCP